MAIPNDPKAGLHDCCHDEDEKPECEQRDQHAGNRGMVGRFPSARQSLFEWIAIIVW
jgi:hypothetical protein